MKHAAASGGNGAPAPPLPSTKFVPKPPQKASGNPPPKESAKEKDSIETATALRVPFGRGPKDKAFRQERQEKPRRDKRGRR
jgi:hypothetical protein